MIDANVLVAGSAWPRWPYEVLQHAVNGDYRLVLADLIIHEAQTSVARNIPAAADRLGIVLLLS